MGAVHPAGGLVEQHRGTRVAGQHHLERETLALAAREVARVGGLAAGQAGGGHAGGPGVVHGVLVDQVVAGVLEQQRHLARPLHATAGGPHQPLGEAQQRALARAVSAHQRHALARRQRQVEPAQHGGPVLDLEPHPAQCQRGRGPAVAPALPPALARAARSGARAPRPPARRRAARPSPPSPRRAARAARRARTSGRTEWPARASRRRPNRGARAAPRRWPPGRPPARSRGRRRAGSARAGARPPPRRCPSPR